VTSINRVPVRLTEERLAHINTNHPELADMTEFIAMTVEKPDAVYAGVGGELLAVKTDVALNKSMVVVYKEVSETDGFIITAFITSKISSISRRSQIWP